MLCELDPRSKYARAPFQVIVRRGMPLREAGCTRRLTTSFS